MSAMDRARAAIGTAALDDVQCEQPHCDRALSVARVEVAGELRALCSPCRKDLWGVSS